MRVLVPLGNRFTSAFVVETGVEPEVNLDIKPVADLLDLENLFSPNMIRLTQWMGEYYLAEWVDILKSALPPALEVTPKTLVTITPLGESYTAEHPLLQMLKEKKTLPLREVYRMFGHRGTFSQLRVLQHRGHVEIIAEKPQRRRGYNYVEAVPDVESPVAPKEKEIFEYMRKQAGAVAAEELLKQFKNSAALLRKMEANGQVRRFWRAAPADTAWPPIQQVEKMNTAQQRAFERVCSSLGSFKVFLLHGVTGSGKTEIYMRLAKKVLDAEKSILILVPEIALLPLVARRAELMLRVPLSILHSELGDRERLEEWQKAKDGKVRLVIGTRSALFAPLQHPGLIVIDEEHDGSYKQGEYPRYHARESAIMRANFEGCPIVLGSATPSIESFFNAGSGKYEYLSLPQRVEERRMPHYHLVDMKTEYRETGDPIFSRLLLQKITERLDRKEQVLVLQNRRGYASLLMCRECGKVLECPHCSITLTFHKQDRRMRCHYCDYARLAPKKCEKCGSAFLHFFGVGTEKIVESLRRLFPHACIEQFDRDTTRKRGSIAQILTRFAHGAIDMLVGTQMLAKGHDFPNITLVGVTGADSAIGLPDFRASERLFQLITQVSGRSGRGSEQGTVILQSFHPDHYAIRASMDQSYQEFYEKEIRFRRLMQYPPYVSLANTVFSGKNPQKVLEEAREFGKLVLAYKKDTMKMLGPAIAPISRLSGLFRFQILIKSPLRKDLRECLHSAVERFQQKEKRHSQFSIDIDPYSIA